MRSHLILIGFLFALFSVDLYADDSSREVAARFWDAAKFAQLLPSLVQSLADEGDDVARISEAVRTKIITAIAARYSASETRALGDCLQWDEQTANEFTEWINFVMSKAIQDSFDQHSSKSIEFDLEQ